MNKFSLSIGIVLLSSFSQALPLAQIETYENLFRQFGSVEVCARAASGYSYSISEKNLIALLLKQEVGGESSCYRMGNDQLQFDPEAGHKYIACARVYMADHCKFAK